MPTARKGQAVCSEKTNLQTMQAVRQPPVPRAATGCVSGSTAADCNGAGTDLGCRADQILREPRGLGGLCRWKPLGWIAFRSKQHHAELSCNLLSVAYSLGLSSELLSVREELVFSLRQQRACVTCSGGSRKCTFVRTWVSVGCLSSVLALHGFWQSPRLQLPQHHAKLLWWAVFAQIRKARRTWRTQLCICVL